MNLKVKLPFFRQKPSAALSLPQMKPFDVYEVLDRVWPEATIEDVRAELARDPPQSKANLLLAIIEHRWSDAANARAQGGAG